MTVFKRGLWCQRCGVACLLALLSIPSRCQSFVLLSPFCRRGHPVVLEQRFGRFPNTQPHHLSKDDKNIKNTEEKTEADQIEPKKELLPEEEVSRRVFNRLLLPTRLGEAFNKTLWALVLFQFLLNAFGYSFLLKDGSLVIDTLENQQFQQEIRRSSRRET